MGYSRKECDEKATSLNTALSSRKIDGTESLARTVFTYGPWANGVFRTLGDQQQNIQKVYKPIVPYWYPKMGHAGVFLPSE